MATLSNLDHSPFFNKLDDVCLQKVFRFLSLRDLCNASEVCRRFKINADEVFKSTNKQLDLLELIQDNSDYHKDWFVVRWLAEQFLKLAEQLFRNFGTYIEALRLTGNAGRGGMDENALLALADNYCPALKQLSLIDVGQDDNFTTELRPMFAGLEKLRISSADVSASFIPLFSDCHEVKFLNVDGVPATMWMNHKFPKLVVLDISNTWEFEYTDWESFLKSHENLRTLRYDDYDIGSEFFAILSKHAPKLETFGCEVAEIFDYDDDQLNDEKVEENIFQLSKLKSLRNLTFMCKESSLKGLVDAFVKETTPIEHFEIFDCEIDSELSAGLSKLKSMTTLKLTRCEIPEDAFINLTSLNRLDKIVFTDMKVMDNDKISLAENMRIVNTSNLVGKLPDQDQGSADILNILNDDCLMAIFEFLPLSDLCNVANVCNRFQQDAQKIFQLHHTCFKTSEISKMDDNGTVRIEVQVVEQLFRNFGCFIENLSLEGMRLKDNMEQETILYLASKYCMPLALHTLTLDHVNIRGPMRWIVPFRNLFYHLFKLELRSCRLDVNFGKFMSVSRITIIKVVSPYGSTEWMNHTFSHLHTFLLVDTWLPESALNEFIKLNRHLKSLEIHHSHFSSRIFKSIAHYMPGLEGFCFAGKHIRDRNPRKNILHLARITSLKHLTLNCGILSIKHLIDELITPIYELNISFATVDVELIDKLANMKALTSLQLRRVKMNKVSLVDVVKKLPKLNELDIDIKGIGASEIIKMLRHAHYLTKLLIGSERSDVQINMASYQLILEIVKKREKAAALCITITSGNRQVSVPKSVLLQSSYWLKIENEIIENLSFIVSDSDSDYEIDENESSDEASDDDIDMEQ